MTTTEALYLQVLLNACIRATSEIKNKLALHAYFYYLCRLYPFYIMYLFLYKHYAVERCDLKFGSNWPKARISHLRSVMLIINTTTAYNRYEQSESKKLSPSEESKLGWGRSKGKRYGELPLFDKSVNDFIWLVFYSRAGTSSGSILPVEQTKIKIWNNICRTHIWCVSTSDKSPEVKGTRG